ncbi:MAG TPA: hypothetical protein VNH11_24210 [Pirellulales bacterium]|nr:hypothetical protein [Pirellulales bacterium]
MAVFTLLFMAGTAFIGLVHQVAWLAAAPEPLTRYRLWKNSYFNSESNLRFIGNGFYTASDYYKRVPPNGKAPELKQGSADLWCPYPVVGLIRGAFARTCGCSRFDRDYALQIIGEG